MSAVEQQVKEFESLVELLEDLDRLGIYGYQRYKTVNRFVTLKARYQDIPVNGSFELTPLCNLDCKMCYVHLQPNQIKQSERLLTVTEWKKIISEAVDAGMIYASLTGGECLTYPGFKEIYLYLYSMGIQPDILTNGRLLTEEMVDFFSKYPPGVIQMTLYGSNEEAYERVTGHRAFQQVVDAIGRVKAAGLNLFLTVSPSRYMKDDVAKLLDLVHSFNVPYTIGDTTLQARSETERDIENYSVELETLYEIKQIERKFTAESRRVEQMVSPVSYVPAKRFPLKGLPCGGGHSSFHVTWRGEVCPCIGFAESVHYNVLDTGFAAVWQRIGKTMERYTMPVECKECSIKEMCVSCPAEKTKSVLNGPLNHLVCNRWEQYRSEWEHMQSESCTVL